MMLDMSESSARPRRTWYTINEVTELLGCDRTTVHRAIKTNRLQAFKVGHMVRIPRTALAAYIDGETPPPASVGILSDDWSTDPPTANLLREARDTDKGAE